MARRGLGHLTELVAFDAPTKAPDGFGGTEVGWAEQFRRRAEFTYQRGSETVEAAALSGRSVLKVRVKSSPDTRRIAADWRMRHVGTETVFNITATPDRFSDRAWVYLTAESGVAV